MANGLDELSDPVSEGRDVRVIAKQLPVTTGVGSIIFEVMLWVLGIIPGLVFLFMKVNARNRLKVLEQTINSNASTVDNYMENRAMILQNCAQLVAKAVKLDDETFTNIAAFRSGANNDPDVARQELGENVEIFNRNLNMAIENYPELKAHESIQSAMKQNIILQKEITAARELYNDSVDRWNRIIFMWPTYMIVAAKEQYKTRIPFSTTAEIREMARGTFFN